MKKVLIVDDEMLIRYSLSAVIKDDRTAVTTASTGTAALKTLSEDFFDFCFLDIHLPDMNGLHILKALKGISPETKVIIMTGGEVDDDSMTMIQENGALFLTKPFDIQFVKAIVAKMGDREHAASRPDHSQIPLQSRVRDRQQYEGANVTVIRLRESTSGRPEEEQAFTADVVDISDRGIGLRTDSPLDTDCMVTIRQGSVQNTGIVRWRRTEEAHGLYRVGIQFV